jgi:D-specific alpha-keto acid dehydrogenase
VLAYGNRCISVGHKTRIADSTLLALSHAGVTHISTRSIGTNHLDVRYAESVGISVATVSYSPDSVADYTLMLMLMAVRNAKSMIRRADVHDYRLPDVRGKEFRDLTIGVIGTGRIGTAVIDRLRGFGCRVLAHDRRPDGSAEWVSLDELVRQSDVVTLHTPLTADTQHLLDRRRIEQMKHGAYVVNTGRGSLLDTEAKRIRRRWFSATSCSVRRDRPAGSGSGARRGVSGANGEGATVRTGARVLQRCRAAGCS